MINFTYKKTLSILLILFSIASLVFIFRLKSQDMTSKMDNGPYATINSTAIKLEVASSSLEKAEGLSGRKSLNPGSGMLFVWNDKISPAFWMIDMEFPIDIIWISDTKIVGIEKNVRPEPGKSPAELQKYFPPEPVNYVLEVVAGFCDQKNIKVGDSVQLSGL